MFVTTRQGNINRNAVAGEALNNGAPVYLKLVGGVYKAFKAAAGRWVDGFATVEPTDPELNRFPQDLATYLSQSNNFEKGEVLPIGKRVLVEQGQGLAKVNNVVAGTYQVGTELTADGAGGLKAAGPGDWVIAMTRNAQVVLTGDWVEIQYDVPGGRLIPGEAPPPPPG
jgi:hypothetical protein